MWSKREGQTIEWNFKQKENLNIPKNTNIVTNNENTIALAHTHKLSYKVNIELTIVRTTDTNL